MQGTSLVKVNVHGFRAPQGHEYLAQNWLIEGVRMASKIVQPIRPP